MTQDRNYLRMLDDCELTHYAKEHGTTELEFVLLERLCTLLDVEGQLDEAKNEITELSDRLDRWMDHAIEALDALDALRHAK